MGLLSTLTLMAAGLVPSAAAQSNGGPGQGAVDPALVHQTEGGRSTVVFGSGRYLTAPSNRLAA